MSKPNIWITRAPLIELNLAPAERHGTMMKPIFSSAVSPHDVTEQVRVITTHVLPFAKREDLLITCGPQMMVMTLAVLWFKEFKEMRVLVWNRSRCEYVLKTIATESP